MKRNLRTKRSFGTFKEMGASCTCILQAQVLYCYNAKCSLLYTQSFVLDYPGYTQHSLSLDNIPKHFVTFGFALEHRFSSITSVTYLDID
jgi:hypothetical protein